jgi:hypothetical protein
MRSSRNCRGCILFVGLIGLLVLPGMGQAAGRNLIAAYAAEFTETCGPPVYPGSLGAVLQSAAPKNWTLKASGPPPLVSREAVLYSMVGTSGLTSLPAARIFAEVQGGSELSFKSDKGQNVVLQADVKSVCWDIDQAKAIETAKAGGAAQTLFAVMRTEDMTADVNPRGQMGKQKSVRVSIDMTLVDSETGAVVASFSDEASQMDLSVNTAARRAARSLVAKGFKSMTSGK